MADKSIPRCDQHIHYVYIIFRWDGRPAYVGKGSGNRWLHHFRPRYEGNNGHLKAIIAAGGGRLPIVKIREGITEREAMVIEVAFIAAIGRRMNGGPLANLTLGGEGASGCKRSQTSINKGAETRKARMHPGIGSAISAGNKARWADPDRRMEAIAGMKVGAIKSGASQKSKDRWTALSEDEKAASLAKMRNGIYDNPAILAKRAKSMKTAWSDPERREKWSAAIKRGHANKAATKRSALQTDLFEAE